MKKSILGGNFILEKKLGKGAFGEIFLGIQKSTKKKVAIKLEDASIKYPQLSYEAKLYKFFHKGKQNKKDDIGIPRAYYYQSEGKKNIMVMDLLGPSLEDLFTMCKRKLTLKSVLMLAD